jgi:hypothetical protein
MTPKQLEKTYRQTYRRLIAMIFAYLLLVVAGIALLVDHPKTAVWATQPVQADFTTGNAPPAR